ncbi:hypothetical protein EYZ11_005676 [Aspergillus tanneri]|nr:hypothetical protein EYZ11_005676 [Aspergillus tanneri]
MHDYSSMASPLGNDTKEPPELKVQIERQNPRKGAFMNHHDTAILNGEFGPV